MSQLLVAERGWPRRKGWDARSDDPEAFLNISDGTAHTPGVSVECAAWLAEKTEIGGFGVETLATDAGRSGEWESPFPCHDKFHAAGICGLTQLRNLSLLPATGTLLVVAPLPIVGGSGSPARVYALIERA